MGDVPPKRPFASDLLIRLPIAGAWISTVVTVAMLFVAALLIAKIPRNSGTEGILEFLGVLLAVAALALSSLVGTICAAIGLRSRYGASNRTSLRASLGINGVVLLGCALLYLVPSFIPSTPTEMFIRASGVWFRPGDQESVTVTVAWDHGDRRRQLPDPKWSSTNPEVFTVAPSGMRAVVTAVAPGVATLRLTSLGRTAEMEVRVVDVTPAPPAARSAVESQVVISQFRLAGPRGEDDDFVELRNRSTQSVDISGWSLAVSDGGGAGESIGKVPPGTSLGPGCPYLFDSARPFFGDREIMYSSEESPLGDFLFWPPIPTEGGLALIDGRGQIVDQAGSHGSRYREGTPLPANDFAKGGSYTRQQDTNDNATDFVAVPKATRMSYESSCGSFPMR